MHIRWLIAAIGLYTTACGGDGPTAVVDKCAVTDPHPTTEAHGNWHQFVVSRVLLPESYDDYAGMIVPDCRMRNRFGTLFSGGWTDGFSPQLSTDASIRNGSTLNVLAVRTSDPMLGEDDLAAVSIASAVPRAAPRFDGTDEFIVDPLAPRGTVYGSIDADEFASSIPAATTHPTTIPLRVALVSGIPVTVPIHGAQVILAHGGCPMDPVMESTPHDCAQVMGSITVEDVNTILLPVVATLLNDVYSQGQSGFDSFDTGGCTNPDGTQAQSHDGVISLCEVSQNGQTANLLAPDVEVYDAQGNYQPSASGDHKNAFSVGFGLDLVPATFVSPE